MKKGQITIKDIANELKISVSTVSRALRDAPEINPATKKIVVDMAKKLNYEPNNVAISLRNSRTHTLGIIVPDLTIHFFASNISGIQDVAAAHGYNVMICLSNESYQTEISNVNTLVTSRVDGILASLSRETANYDHLNNLRAKGIPLVLFDRVSDEVDTSKVIVDDHDGAFMAVEHLIQTGCKRIAHISGPESLSISKTRLKGYLDAMQAYNMEVSDELIVRTNLTENDNYDTAKALIDIPNPPDGIFAITDPVAIRAMVAIKEKGLRIPEDIAVVGFTNAPISTIIEPSLTTVSQPAYSIGQISANLVLDQINNPEEFIHQSVVLKTELIVRNSTRKKV
jgi:DNA-binding LacI/PurR family transcriptional regulator